MKNKKTAIILTVLAIVCVAAVVVMVLALTREKPAAKGDFTPPDFETAAIAGTPEVSDSSWTKVYQDGMSFSAHVCGRVNISGGAADLYFSNDDGNEVWLKLRITDEDGKILAETGLIKPNEYIKSVSFDTVPENGTKIKLKIMAYEPNTYYSAGAVSLNTTAGG